MPEYRGSAGGASWKGLSSWGAVRARLRDLEQEGIDCARYRVRTENGQDEGRADEHPETRDLFGKGVETDAPQIAREVKSILAAVASLFGIFSRRAASTMAAKRRALEEQVARNEGRDDPAGSAGRFGWPRTGAVARWGVVCLGVVLVLVTLGWLWKFDDFGDDAASARTLRADGLISGELERPGDVDYFRVTVERTGRLSVETSGETDTVGRLAGNGMEASNDDGGDGSNFRITETVVPGTYTVRVGGFNDNTSGDYTLWSSLEEMPMLRPDGGSSAGVLRYEGDIGYFALEVEREGRLTLRTTGPTDTVGVLRGEGVRVRDDDDGEGRNFRLAEVVRPGNYWVEVSGYNGRATGEYRLRASFEER